jgi:hypothetical protein
MISGQVLQQHVRIKSWPSGVFFWGRPLLGSISCSKISICPCTCRKVVDALAVFGAKMVHESQGTAPNFVHDLIAQQIGQPNESGAIQTFCYPD